jgi:dipeptidyl aminopeptidase/acylaminoacyl peptidase
MVNAITGIFRTSTGARRKPIKTMIVEATALYTKISPSSHAHKINEPNLMIHGEADHDTGTFAIQLERLFQAIKGNGGTARLVMLPHESHGYRARESVLHVVAEMLGWADRYVKNRPVSAGPGATTTEPSATASGQASTGL